MIENKESVGALGLKVNCSSMVEYYVLAINPFESPENQNMLNIVLEILRRKPERQNLQLNLDGFNASNRKPYRELGYPLILNSKQLILETLGHLTKKPNIAKIIEQYEREHEFGQPIQSEMTIPEFETLELTSTATQFTKHQIRPFVRESKKNDEPLQAMPNTKFLERRRKRGYCDMKQVFKSSEGENFDDKALDSIQPLIYLFRSEVERIRRGRSFFDLLNKIMLNELSNHWEERKQLETKRNTVIRPPNKYHLIGLQPKTNDGQMIQLDSIKNENKCTKSLADKRFNSNFYPKRLETDIDRDIQELNEDAVKEDALILKESEFLEVARQLVRAGYTLPSDLPVHFRKAVLDGNDFGMDKAEKTHIGKQDNIAKMTGQNEIGRMRSNETSADLRWKTQQSRYLGEPSLPFAPYFVNITRRDIVSGWMRDEPDESDKNGADVGSHCDKEQTDDNDNAVTMTKPKMECIETMIYMQLCCLDWLLQRMLNPRLKERRLVDVISNSFSDKRINRPIKDDIVKANLKLVQKGWLHFLATAGNTTSSNASAIKQRRRKDSRRKVSISSSSQRPSRSSIVSSSGSLPGQSPGYEPLVFWDDGRSLCSQWSSGSRSQSLTSSSRLSTPSSGIRPRRGRLPSVSSIHSSRTLSSRRPLSRQSDWIKTLRFEGDDEGETISCIDEEGQEGLDFNRKLRKSICPALDGIKSILDGNCISIRRILDQVPRHVISEIAQAVEDDLDKEAARDRMMSSAVESRKVRPKLESSSSVVTKTRRRTSGQGKSVPTSSDQQWSELLQTQRSHLDALRERAAIDFQDRLDVMTQLRPEICHLKFDALSTDEKDNCEPFHKVLDRIEKTASYGKAIQRMTVQSKRDRQLATWYSDLVGDLKALQASAKIKRILEKLQTHALLPTSQFTSTSFGRLLERLPLWELCAPTTSTALDFIRYRILELSYEESVEWLVRAHPSLEQNIARFSLTC